MITKTNGRSPGPIGELPPFPKGWYFIASRESILREKLIEKTWLGEEIVVWCDAKCPHLGSHLGPSVGGKVRDGCLVCPFHGFEFDASGQCVTTPNAPAPRGARLQVYETREILGMVFAWWGSGDRPPQWYLPDEPHTGAEWCKVGFRTLRFPGHVQQLAENSVDFGHLGYVHGYDNVTPVGSISVEGAYLRSSFEFKRVRRVAGMDVVYEVSAVTHIYGLGYSFVEIHKKTIDMRARYWVLATPVDSKRVELVLANQVRQMRKPRRPIMGLRFLPTNLRHRVMNQIALTQQKRDVQQDVVIWERMQYCRQFYPEPTISEAS